jgi:RNA polymerase sigma factor (sigma-70 family)
MGIGTLGLIKAIDKYEIQRDSKFSTFAYKVILNEMFYAIRKNGNYNSEINFDINLSDDDTLIGKTPVEQCLLEKYLEKELLEAISQQLTNFTEKQKRIIRLNFGFDCERKTQEDIGKEIGCGQKNVSRIVNEVTDDIRPDLKRQGLVDLARSKSITTRGSKKVVTKQKNKKEININVTQTKDIVYQEKLAYLFCGYNEKQIKTLIGLLENSGEKQVLLLMLGYVNNKKYSASEAAKIANIKTSKVYEVIDSALENIFGVSDIEVIIPKERVKKGIVC